MTDNRDQQDFWTNIAGPQWVEHQAAMDALMQPVLDGVMARAGLADGAHVLDIGCGTGASALVAAELVGPDGSVLGVDISSALLGLARTRAQDHPTISFLEVDAAAHSFEPSRFDHLISRFGVMFFSDPVSAFANMARALKPGARMDFAAWGQIPNNPFFTVPARAARDVLGAMPKTDPDAPGPFAFSDVDRVTDMLARAGFSDVSAEVTQLDLTPAGTPADFVEQCCTIGPVEAALRYFEADDAQHAQIRDRLRDVLTPFDSPQGLRIPAEINFFSARISD